MKPKILITDDEPLTRNMMARVLGDKYDCLTAPDAEAAFALVVANPDLALLVTDYKMPGENGIELIRRAKRQNPALGCILITAFGEIELAVEAMKDGADDFLTKPITDLAQLELRVAKAIKTAGLEKEVASLKEQLTTELENFTGTSPAMERVYQTIRKVAPTDATVLIEGPSGSGKELAARALHSLSRRAAGPFVALECSAFPGELLKSELFGYAPGTFTGGLKDGKAGCIESAAGGTLFLDEIGEIDTATQIALLRTLETKSVRRLGAAEEKPVDFRLVAATNKDLSQMVVDGTFREDLFYRLNVIDLRMPALKRHPEDIALLVARFIKEFSVRHSTSVTGIERDAMKALEDYSWPGNVRQLRNVIEKMCVLSSGGKLTLDDIPVEIARPRPAQPLASVAMPRTQPTPTQTLRAAEKEQILQALQICNGNKSRTAKELGISRRTLHRKLNEWRTTP